MTRLAFVLLVACGARTELAVEATISEPASEHRTLSMAWSTACAIARGDVYCWGDNSLGLTTGPALRATPTRVEGLSDVVEVGVGQLIACALDASGAVYCWGQAIGAAAPIRTALPNAERLFVGSGTVCAIAGGELVCTGNTLDSEASCQPVVAIGVGAVRTIPLDGVTDVAIGQRHVCALHGGEVSCFGCNEWMELGAAGPLFTFDPLRVDGVRATSIAAETHATCAIGDAGVTCWGEGSQFGTRLTFDPGPPREVAFEAPIDLDVGVITTCAAGANIECRGSQFDLPACTDRWNGDATYDLSAREISIGIEDMCARNADGVYCWGCNSTGAIGRIGDGSAIPVRVDF